MFITCAVAGFILATIVAVLRFHAQSKKLRDYHDQKLREMKADFLSKIYER